MKVLDITPLRSLIAIADSGGFHRAAHVLSLTQSAVSQHVRRLETVTGAPIVERDGRGVRFTPNGELLLAEARRIIAAHDQALERLGLIETEQLVIGLTEHGADSLLDLIRATVAEAAPSVRVRFRLDRTTAINQALDQSTVDLAVFITEARPGSGEIIGALPLRWCAVPGWRKPAAGQPVPLVAIQHPCTLRTTAMNVLAEHGDGAEVVAEAAYLSGVLDAVRAGLGVALLAYADRPPDGLAEVDELPAVGPARFSARVRPGVNPELAGAVLRALRERLFAVAV